MRTSTLALLATVVGVASLAGCYESPQVVTHKPGVYKGPKDPLVDKQRDAKQQEALVARFNQIQTDR